MTVVLVVAALIVLAVLLFFSKGGAGARKDGGGNGGNASSLSNAGTPHSLDLERDSKQFLSIVDREQSGLDLSDKLTIEAWVKLESLGESNTNHTMIDKGNAKENNVSYRFYWRNNDPALAAHDDVNLMLSSDGSTRYAPWSVPYQTRTGVWTHLATTFDGATGKAAIYVNGQPQPDTAAHPVINAVFMNNQPFFVGVRGGSFDFLDGKIDEVRVWNVVRSASDIQNNYLKELAGNEPGLAGYWKFNAELVDGKMKDSSAQGNNLKPANGPSFSEDVPF